jgi:AMMECR1 domain-containing protein
MLFNLRLLPAFAIALMFALAGGMAREMSLPEISRNAMAVYFGDKDAPAKSVDELADRLVVKKHFLKSGGVFVTLFKNGKTRACWGSVYPQAKNIAQGTIYATMGALTKEYRYKPISATEWKKLKVQVTVIKGVEPITSIAFQNPLRDGLLVRSGGKNGVYLPGEAADAHYQLVQCKLKAGIKSGEPCQLYRLRTEIYD